MAFRSMPAAASSPAQSCLRAAAAFHWRERSASRTSCRYHASGPSSSVSCAFPACLSRKGCASSNQACESLQRQLQSDRVPCVHLRGTAPKQHNMVMQCGPPLQHVTQHLRTFVWNRLLGAEQMPWHEQGADELSRSQLSRRSSESPHGSRVELPRECTGEACGFNAVQSCPAD